MSQDLLFTDTTSRLIQLTLKFEYSKGNKLLRTERMTIKINVDREKRKISRFNVKYAWKWHGMWGGGAGKQILIVLRRKVHRHLQLCIPFRENHHK